MRTALNILKQIPEYVFFILLLPRSPFRPFFPPLILFGVLYMYYIRQRAQQKDIHPLIVLSVYAYYSCLFYLALFLLRLNLSLSFTATFLFVALLAYTLRMKKLRAKMCFVVFIIFSGLLLTFSRGTERHNSARYRKALSGEKFAKLLVSSDPQLPAPAMLDRIIKTKNVSVRNIFIDEKEEFLYFTAVPPDQNYRIVYPALFKVSLKKPSRVQFIRYYYCNNFVYDKKRKQFYLPVRMKPEVLVVDPVAFTIKKHIAVPSRYNALDLFLDEKNDRLIAVPEGGRLWLYDLHEKTYTETNRSLYYYSNGVLDAAASKLYTISYLGPYLLKEYDTNTLQCKNKFTGFLEPAWSLSYDNMRRMFYVAGFFSGKIHVISQTDLQPAGMFYSKPGVRPVLVDSQRNVIYAGNYLEDDMSVLNNDGYALGKIFVGKRCRSLFLSPRSRRLFAGTSIGILEIHIDGFMKHWRKNINKK